MNSSPPKDPWEPNLPPPDPEPQPPTPPGPEPDSPGPDVIDPDGPMQPTQAREALPNALPFRSMATANYLQVESAN